MDIFIHRAGTQMGPYTEAKVRSLISSGAVLETDWAWRYGMQEWAPLLKVLGTVGSGISAPPPPVPQSEPATARQKAFLSYMGLGAPEGLTKEKAALMMNDLMESPADAARVTKWNEDKVRLHPDLFAEEIKARKESRPTQFHEICSQQGAELFTGLTKAHTQVLIQYLDNRLPNWDGNPNAVEKYLFPAIAEKFPQLLTRNGRNKLRGLSGSRVAPEVIQSAAQAKADQRSSPVTLAIVRGVIIGLVILVVMYLIQIDPKLKREFFSVIQGSPEVTPAPVSSGPTKVLPPTLAEADEDEEAAPPARKPKKTRAVASANKVDDESDEMATPPMSGAAPESNAVAMGTGMTAEPSMAAANPPASGGLPVAPPEVGMSGAPVAAAPGMNSQTPDPFAPPPAESASPMMAAVPRLTPVPVPDLVLTKPTAVALQYGNMVIPARTVLKFVSRDGSNLRVRHGAALVTVPIANTNFPEINAALTTASNVAAKAAALATPAPDPFFLQGANAAPPPLSAPTGNALMNPRKPGDDL